MMKALSLFLLTAALAAPQDRAKQTAAPETPKPSVKDQAATSIPAGATLVEPNLYRYTDAKGKTWMYRRTPFGVSKWEEQAVAQPVIPETNPPRVTDLGDSIQFERKTPFGSTKWTQKKTELTEEEKAWVASSKTDDSQGANDKTSEKK